LKIIVDVQATVNEKIASTRQFKNVKTRLEINRAVTIKSQLNVSIRFKNVSQKCKEKRPFEDD
jgi:hypothetical protein